MYAYHFTTVKNMALIRHSGFILPRAIIGHIIDDVADPELIKQRKECYLAYRVPLYVNHTPPMWLKLVKYKRISINQIAIIKYSVADLIASELDVKYLMREKSTENWFSVGARDALRISERYERELPWYEVSDVSERHAQMLAAQMEVSVGSRINLNCARASGPITQFKEIYKKFNTALTCIK